MWLRVDGFKEMVKKWWIEAPKWEGNKDFSVFKKLQHIKGKLKVWNRESFQKSFKRKGVLEEEIKTLNEKIIQEGMNEEDF